MHDLPASWWRGAPAAALALLLSQLLFWVGLGWAESLARPAAIEARPWVEYVELDAAGQAAPDAPRARARYEPDPNYKARLEGGPGPVRFEIPFDVDAPTRDLALYLGARRSIQEIRLNGLVIKPNVPLDSFSGGAGWEPVFYMLPASELRAGTNDVAVLVASEGFAHVFPEFQVGPAEDVARAYGFGRLFNVDLPLVAIGILLFTALLCLAVNWPPEDRARIRALVVLLAVWALGSYTVAFSPPFALSREATILAYYSISIALPMAAAWYVMHQTGSPASARRLLLWAWAAAQAWLVVVSALVAAGSIDPRRWLGGFQLLNLGATALAGIGGLLLLARALRDEGGRLALERVLLMVCLTALLVDTADSVLKLHVPFHPALPLTFYAAPLAGLLLGLGMVAALAREATLARRVVATANRVLAERLAAREAELAAVHEREKRLLAQRATLEERQRIVRDMHDGVGGRLLGLQMQLRHGQPAQARVEEAVTSSLADLRLMVDALDAPDAPLSEVLLGFERRLREQLQGSGIALEFDVAPGADDPVLGAGPALQLLRLLQEAVSNACRHARPRRLALRVQRDGERLVLAVQDDGVGMPGEVKPGRGLASMQARAAALGATLRIAPAAPGTRVEVTLPVRTS
jgi:signal transduction histidine kinase